MLSLFIVAVGLIAYGLSLPSTNTDRTTNNSFHNSGPAIKKIRKTYINNSGYACFLDSHKLVHRWVMKKTLGRRLEYGEVVHHIDGDKLNNKINNLKLFSSQIEHDKYHREHLKNYGNWYEEVPEYAQKNFYKYN